MRDIGKNIKLIRQAKGMTQDALAEALYVTRQTVSNYENGRSRPDLDMLVKIGEVLDTDVNTIIYGPPVPQSKRASYIWAVTSSALLVITVVLYFVFTALIEHIPYYHYHLTIFAKALNKEILIPTAMFLLGWVLLHGLSLFSGLRQLQGKYAKLVKIALLIVLSILILIPLPCNCWYFWILICNIRNSSFDYGPFYMKILWSIQYVIYHAPFLYSILGGLFWLFGLPRIKKINEARNINDT